MAIKSANKSWLVLALGVSVLASACGPVAPSISKALLNQSSSDQSTRGGIFSGEPGVLSFSADDKASVMAEETHFLSDEIPAGANGPEFQVAVTQQKYRQVQEQRRVQITEARDLEPLRDGDDTVEIELPNGGFPEIKDDSKIHVLVELDRRANQIPDDSLLPQAQVSLVQSDEEGVEAQILRIKFMPVTDPTAEPRESVLRDVKRIHVYSIE